MAVRSFDNALFLYLRLNTWLYMLTSIVGVVLVHIAFDNISKFLKEGLLKDRFNFENESFEQCRSCRRMVQREHPYALLLQGQVPQGCK